MTNAQRIVELGRKVAGELGPRPNGAGEGHEPGRLAIEVRAGELPRLVRESEAALIAAAVGIYQRAGLLVRIAQLDADTVQHGIQRSSGSTLIIPVTPEYLTLALSRAAEWERYDGRAKAMRRIDPPRSVSRSLIAAVGEWHLPTLAGLTAAPTLRADGSLLDAPGYDAASGLYGTFETAAFPSINSRPSREDALAALALLQELFSECAFAGGAQSAYAAVALAATVTAAVRNAVPTAPGFGLSAHKAGSGKTTLGKAIAQVCTGREPPVLALSDDEAELRKTLLAILIAGDACVLVDNVAHAVSSAALCAVLTSASYSDRLLGVNQRLVVPTACTWLITGNHLEFVGDLTSRVLLSVLDPEVEHPESRPFRRELAEYVAAHRGELLAAVLTIPLAYLAAGEPSVEAPRSRFTQWDRLVRRPLLWLDIADPLDTQAELRGGDPVRETLLAVLSAWKKAFGEEPTTVHTAIETAKTNARDGQMTLLEALQGAAGNRDGTINARRLGRYLVRHARRIEGGLRLEAVESNLTTCRRQFSVTSVFGVNCNPTREMAGNSRSTNESVEDNAGNARRKCARCAGEGCNWCRREDSAAV